MTGWAERAKTAIAQQGATAKIDESISPKLLAVSSVLTKDIPLIEKRVSSVLTVSLPSNVEKNDSISAIKEDPDRWCWPNSPAMNSREIDLFSIRLEKFRSVGVDLDTAERLADRLVIRDRDNDDRIVCFECYHLRNGWLCVNSRNAGVWPHHSNLKLHNDFVHQLQRCPGFKPTIGEVNEHK